MSCSLGVALVARPRDRSIVTLFAEADSALYAAKSGGGAGIGFHGEERADDVAIRPLDRTG